MWYCGHAYAVTRNYVAQVLAIAERPMQPWDLDLQDWCKMLSCRIYAVSPMLFAQVPRTDKNKSVSDNILADQILHNSTLACMGKTLRDFQDLQVQ